MPLNLIAPAVLGTLYLLGLIVLMIKVIGVRRHHYVLESGFLYVTRGVLSRTSQSFEILHLTEVEINRPFFDLLTGNTRIHLHFSVGGRVTMRGIIRPNEAEEFRASLLNLARLIRINPMSRLIER